MLFKKIRSVIRYLLEEEKVPENHESCPSCDGMGTDDGFTRCELCNGNGHVSFWKARSYENTRLRESN
jgi:RecJ-like exonuclease